MSELLTAAAMRAIERAAIEGGAVTGLQLMEWAGRGVVAAVFAEWPALAQGARHAVVLCGPGNNGGDGFVVARRLVDRGWRVEVLFHGAPGNLPPDARRNHDVWRGMGAVGPLTPETAGQGDRPDLLVDAMFGTGLGRPVPRDLAGAFHAVTDRAARGEPRPVHVVAVDCPSGLDCDTGEFLFPDPPTGGEDADDSRALSALQETVAAARRPRADLTVTFHRAKLGHYLGAGPTSCGRLRIVDIGLGMDGAAPPPGVAEGGCVRLVGPEADGRWPAQLVAPRGTHKYDRGHVLVLAGGPGRGGAARLAARAALRAGAGLVTVGCSPSALAENAARLDAIMLRAFREVTDLIEFLADGRISAVCLGPGLGRGERAQQMVTAVLAAERATVLDADALTTYEDDPQGLFYQLHEACVLTPHEGEFARLFPDLGQKARGAMSKVEAARRAAERAGCTVLLKGADTVIASLGRAVSLHAAAYDRAAPWLATAGAGDVLAGLIAGLLAGRGHPEEVHGVAEAAAWLHTECARAFGPGLIAEDLPEELPKVLRELGL